MEKKYFVIDCIKISKELNYNNNNYCYFLFNYLCNGKNYILDKEYEIFITYINRLKNGEPIDSIIGYTEFLGLKFQFSKYTLTPRQETENFTKYIISVLNKFDKKLKILDLCAGSGCIGLSIAKYTKHSVTLADISDYAISEIKQNALNFNIIVNVVKSDMFDMISGSFDVIVCNPPYICENEYNLLEKQVREYDPKLALIGGTNGYEFYQVIKRNLAHFLKKEGILFLEFGSLQKQDIKNLFSDSFKYVKIMSDYSGLDRNLIATNKENLC